MDITSLPVEYDTTKIDSKYRLVNITVQRAKDLVTRGEEPRVVTKAKKVTTIAIEEAIQNKLEFLTGEEAVRAREEAKKFDFRKLFEEKKLETETEDLSDLEKDLNIFIQGKNSAEEPRKPDEVFESEE
jgi:DNA-directed RNA polymerase subunit omega